MHLKHPKYTRSFRSFINKYNPGQAHIINLSLEATEKIGNTTVHTMPFYQSPLKYFMLS
jgi:hypothetical protein